MLNKVYGLQILDDGEQVVTFDITMKNSFVMKELKAFQQLLHQTLDMLRSKFEVWMSQDASKVVIHVFKHHIHCSFGDH